MPNARRILVVEPEIFSQHQIVSALRQRDYLVAAAATVPQASLLISRSPFDLLIAATRLYTSSGIQFVIATRTRHREMAAILVGPENERALVEMDARRHGFAFLARPFLPEQLLMVAAEQLATIRHKQQWPRKRLASHVRARIGCCEARLTDVSYAGVGFELATDPGALPLVLQIELVDSPLRVDGVLVWSARREADGGCAGGIHLRTSTLPVEAWRQFVDRVC